ncbi:MAG: retroviral-like aspartic protease family protein, partial [Candidatus Eisenbacteria bacterium]
MTDSPKDSSLGNAIEQHLGWLGGRENLDELHTLYMSGRISAAGLEGTITIQMMRPDRFHLHYELGPLRGTEVLDGEKGWRINETGQIEALGVETRAGHEWSLDSAFSLTLLGRTKRAMSLLPPEQRDGKSWNVLRVSGEQGQQNDLLLDPEYGALEWTRTIADGDTTWTHSTDWRADHGVRFPYVSKQLHDNPAGDVETEWTQFVVNAELDPSVFERPAESVRIGHIEGGAESTDWIPIERYQERWVYLRGKLNGAETDIVLDSGAGMTVVDRSFAESIGLESSGALAASGVGGTDQASVASALSVDLGGLTFEGITAAILDLSGVARRLGRPIPVIFGKEAFHEFVVDLDYPNERIAFHDPESFEYAGAGHELELISADGGHKLVMLSIDGLPETEFHLDTGSGGTVTLFPHFVEANHLLEGRTVSDTKMGGVGGDMIALTGSLERVEIAGFQLDDVPVTFFPGGEGAFDTERQQGNLGAGILSRFRTIFDYGRSR